MSESKVRAVMRAKAILKQKEGFAFEISTDSPEGWTEVMDEPRPLGQGRGPNAARMLAFAVGHCLSASLLFCLQKGHIPLDSGMETEVEAVVQRNEQGRWRVEELNVRISLPPELSEHRSVLERCLDLFEDYCIVTASVRRGIPVQVNVQMRE